LVPILVCLSALTAQSEKVSVEFGECSSAPYAETAAALLQNAQSKRMAPLDKIFDTIDVNNDSMLDPSEFKPWYEAQHSQAGSTAAPATETMAAGTTNMPGGVTTEMGATGMAAGTTAAAAATAMAGATTDAMAAATTAMPAGTTAAAATGMAAATTGAAAATGMAVGTTGAAAAATNAATDAPATTAMPMKTQGTDAPMAPTTAAPEMTATPLPTAATAKPANRSVAQVLKYVATTPSNASGHIVKTKGKTMTLTDFTGDLLEGQMKFFNVFGSVDMIVSVVDRYQAKSPNENGVKKGLGVINMLGGTNTTFKFSFVHSGSASPVVIDELYFSLVEMTVSAGLVKQATMVSGFEHVYMDPTTGVKWQRRDGSSPSVFRGTIEAPQYSALDQDRRKSVAFRFVSVGEFMINLGTPGGSSSVGRNFYFAGRGPVVTGECVANSKFVNPYFAQVAYSNLGGMGPSFGSPHGISYKHVLEIKDEDSELGYIPVDVLVKNTAGKYRPGMAEQNGCAGGGIGSINFEGGTVATFSFSLVDNSLKGMPQEDFVLTFMDLDKSPRGGTTDSFTLHGFKNAYLSDNSAFEMTEGEKGKTFTATFNDDPYSRKTKPANAFDLTVEQQTRSFSVEFSRASMITLTADFSALPEGYSRTLYFAGHSRLSAGREIPFLCEA